MCVIWLMNVHVMTLHARDVTYVRDMTHYVCAYMGRVTYLLSHVTHQ